jgi:hypothetical protein
LVERESEETSVKVHCVANATRIIPRPKRCHGNIPRSNMSQNATGFQRILLHKCTCIYAFDQFNCKLTAQNMQEKLDHSKTEITFCSVCFRNRIYTSLG